MVQISRGVFIVGLWFARNKKKAKYCYCLFECTKPNGSDTYLLFGVRVITGSYRIGGTGLPHYNAIFGVHRNRPCYK